MRKDLRQLGAAALIVIGVVLGVATPALAHGTSASVYYSLYNSPKLGHGGVTASHHYVYACDDYRNGNSVYTEFYYQGRGPGRVYDSSSPGCNQIRVDPAITDYRVCEDVPWQRDSCSSWRRV